MSHLMMWYETKMPENIAKIIYDDLHQYDLNLKQGGLTENNTIEKNIRNSKIGWIPSSHWSCGMCYNYILQANMNNFKYHIDDWSETSMQYTSYREGEFYNWHVDTSLPDWFKNTNNHQENYVINSSEKVRKLSFTLQLSDPSDYDGGELQFLTDDNNTFFAPKTRGSIIIFDSRLRHRVKKVTRGERKSLVGWIWGPRWK